MTRKSTLTSKCANVMLWYAYVCSACWCLTIKVVVSANKLVGEYGTCKLIDHMYMYLMI